MNYDHDLYIYTDRKSWQVPSTFGTEADSNKKLIPLWEKIWKRDDYKCRFCLFRSVRFQEIFHINHDHENNKEENLATICPLCHQCFHPNTASITGGGRIIWMPELNQQDLNHLCRSIFIAMENENEDDSLSRMAFASYNAIASREECIRDKNHFHIEASDPGMFAQILLNLTDEKKRDSNWLHYFKLMPNLGRFESQVKYWRKEVYADLPVSSWPKLAEQLRAVS